jgi:mitofusin
MVIVLPLFLEQMSGLLPAEMRQVLLTALLQREPFEILYRLNCDNLHADFHENLDFRFSGVCRSVISSVTRNKANSTTLTNYSQQGSMLYIPYFPTDNAHPKLFCIPFEVQITRT